MGTVGGGNSAAFVIASGADCSAWPTNGYIHFPGGGAMGRRRAAAAVRRFHRFVSPR